MIDHLAIAPVVLPLIAAAAMLLVGERRHRSRAGVSIASTFGLVGIAVALLVMSSDATAPVGVYRLGDWPAPLAIVLVVDRLSAEARPDRWRVSRDEFEAAVTRSVTHRFGDRLPVPAEVRRYLGSIRAADLALAVACANGDEGAWEHFVLTYRPALYRAAAAIAGPDAGRDLADSLYADLFGLDIRHGERRSLFTYFHGRSSLATWLRSLVAQRYVDRIREQRRIEPLPEESSPAAIPARPAAESPDRSRFVSAMQAALAAAIATLEPRDRLRLRCYYAQEMTLAQIGKVTREHEATVSRQLARTRKDLRGAVEARLRDEHRFGAAEIADCFSSVSEDAGTLDLGVLFEERKKTGDDRSKTEDVS